MVFDRIPGQQFDICLLFVVVIWFSNKVLSVDGYIQWFCMFIYMSLLWGFELAYSMRWTKLGIKCLWFLIFRLDCILDDLNYQKTWRLQLQGPHSVKKLQLSAKFPESTFVRTDGGLIRTDQNVSAFLLKRLSVQMDHMHVQMDYDANLVIYSLFSHNLGSSWTLKEIYKPKAMKKSFFSPYNIYIPILCPRNQSESPFLSSLEQLEESLKAVLMLMLLL